MIMAKISSSGDETGIRIDDPDDLDYIPDVVEEVRFQISY